MQYILIKKKKNSKKTKKYLWAKRFELLHLTISRPKRDALDHSAKPTNVTFYVSRFTIWILYHVTIYINSYVSFSIFSSGFDSVLS